MLTIPGLRAEKVIKLYQELGLTSVEELEDAARERKLQKVKGLGASLQSKILRGLELRREAQGRRHMHKADELLRTAEKHLKEARPEIIRITRAGDFRRGSELAGDLSLVAEVPKLPDGRKAITAGGQLTAPIRKLEPWLDELGIEPDEESDVVRQARRAFRALYYSVFAEVRADEGSSAQSQPGPGTFSARSSFEGRAVSP